MSSAMWRIVSVALGIGCLLGLALGTAPPAAASSLGPADQTVGPAPGPPPTIDDSGIGCNPFGVGNYKTDLDDPERVTEGIGPSASGPLRGNGIHGEGYIDVWNNTSCSQAQVKFLLQTKVCNRWGHLCSWRAIKEGEWTELPIQGRIEGKLTGECRSGVDTYKMTAIVSHVEASFEDTPTGRFVPYLETKSDDFDSNEVKLDCG